MLNLIRLRAGFFAAVVGGILLTTGSLAQTADTSETQQTATTELPAGDTTKILSSKEKLKMLKADQERLALFCNEVENSSETECVGQAATQEN